MESSQEQGSRYDDVWFCFTKHWVRRRQNTYMAGTLERTKSHVLCGTRMARELNPIQFLINKNKKKKCTRKKEDICPNHCELSFWTKLSTAWTTSQPHFLLSYSNLFSFSLLFLFLSQFFTLFLQGRDHHDPMIQWSWFSLKGEQKQIMGSTSRVGSSSYDYSFKVLLIGDSAVGKSSLLLSFISNSDSINDLSPTIGTFFFSFLLRKTEQGGTGSCWVFVNSTPLSRLPSNNDEGLFL